jgi:hypothetical protein
MAFNSYAAGRKQYGAGRSMPTVGPVDKMGYRERDAKSRVKNQAILRRIKNMQNGNFNNPSALRGLK